MKVLFTLLLLVLVASVCPSSENDNSDSSNSAKSRQKRQVSDNTGIVNIPDNFDGATPPPTAGPLTPGPTLPPTTARPGFFGPSNFNFPSLFNFGGSNPGFGSNNAFDGFGGNLAGFGGASNNAGGNGGFPTFPSFPTPRPNTGGFGPNAFPPLNGNGGFPPLSGGTGGFPNNDNTGNTGTNNNNDNNNNNNNINNNNNNPAGFPDFGGFGSNVGGAGSGNSGFPGFPPLGNGNGANPFPGFPSFSTRAPPTFPNLPSTPRPQGFDTNICTPPVFTPLGDRVGNETLPQDVVTAINQELSFNPQLSAFLSFASQVNGAPINNDNNENSDLSCPSTKQRATVFQRYGAKCWILQDQQQPVFYATCTCNQCLSPTGFQQPPGSACEPFLQPTQVFAYCLNALNSQNKITQERVAVPVTCRCRHAAPAATQTPPVVSNGVNNGGGGFNNGGVAVPVNTTPSPGIGNGIAGINPDAPVIVGRAK